MIQIRRLAAPALLLVIASTASAAKYAGEFMYVGAGARALGMGGAFVAIADDATAAYWNPAGLVMLQGSQVQLMHSERFGGLIRYDYLAYARNDGRNALAASLFRTDAGDIADTTGLQWYDTGSDGVAGVDGQGEPGDSGNDDYDPDTNPDGTEGNGEWDPGEELIYDEGRLDWGSAVDYALYLSWARPVTSSFSAGASAKVIQRTLLDHSAWGLGLDAGVQWRPVEHFSAGLNIQDTFGTHVFWDTGSNESVLPTAKLGMATTWNLGRFSTVATIAADGDFRFEGRQFSAQYHAGDVSLDTHFGVDLLIHDRVSLRVGSSEGNLTAGAGLRVGLFGRPVTLDYAFLGHEDLDDTHRISLGVGF
jgi:hypothetical protein